MNRFLAEDVVLVSSIGTDEALEFLALDPSHHDSPRFIQDEAYAASSEHRSDWFEDWPEANDMATSAYVTLTTEPSFLH
jgi:hypothetical protein